MWPEKQKEIKLSATDRKGKIRELVKKYGYTWTGAVKRVNAEKETEQ